MLKSAHWATSCWLNTVGDGDNEPHYGAVKSSDEAEKNDIETGEFDLDEDMEPQCAPDDDHDHLEETEQKITAKVLFAENFLSQFGGEDEDKCCVKCPQ